MSKIIWLLDHAQEDIGKKITYSARTGIMFTWNANRHQNAMWPHNMKKRGRKRKSRNGTSGTNTGILVIEPVDRANDQPIHRVTLALMTIWLTPLPFLPPLLSLFLCFFPSQSPPIIHETTLNVFAPGFLLSFTREFILECRERHKNYFTTRQNVATN